MKKFIIPALFSISFAANGQTLNKEITIDKDVIPVEQSANRQSLLPNILSPELSPIKLQFDQSGIPVSLRPETYLYNIPSTFRAIRQQEARGYLDVGYFPIYNAGVSAGYDIIRTETDRLGAWLQFNGATWKDYNEYDSDTGPGIPYETKKQTYKSNNLSIGLDYNHNIENNMNLFTGLRYTGSWLDDSYDGSQSVYDLSLYLGLSGSASQRFKNYSTLFFDAFGFSKIWNSHYLPQEANPVKQINGGLKGYLSYILSEKGSSSVGFEYKLDIIHSNGACISSYETERTYYKDPGTKALISITPSFQSQGSAYYLKLGVNASFAFNDGHVVHVAPDIAAGVHLSPYFTIGIAANGGTYTNTVQSLFQESQFINSAYKYSFSNIPLNSEVSMTIGPMTGLSLKVFGGYSIANNWLMPLTDYFNHSLYAVDLKAWKAGAEVRWVGNKWVDLHASATFAPSKFDRALWEWRDRAKMVIDARIVICPQGPFTLTAGLELRTGRKYCRWMPDQLIDNVWVWDLKNVLNVKIGARYTISNNLAVFGRIENLLNKQWEDAINDDIQSKKIHGLLGINYTF